MMTRAKVDSLESNRPGSVIRQDPLGAEPSLMAERRIQDNEIVSEVDASQFSTKSEESRLMRSFELLGPIRVGPESPLTGLTCA